MKGDERGLRGRLGLLWILCLTLLAGCSVRTLQTEKLRDLSYEEVEEEDVPEEMRGPIGERKGEPFVFTYADKGELFIARGYGEQKTGGYKIQVTEFYESENAIVLKTTFLGPEPGEHRKDGPAYPYLVLRTEYSDKDVLTE